MSKREGWYARALDPAFLIIPTDCQPMPVPFPDYSSTLPSQSTTDTISTLDEIIVTETVIPSHKEPEILMAVIDRLRENYQAFLARK